MQTDISKDDKIGLSNNNEKKPLNDLFENITEIVAEQLNKILDER